MQINFIKPVWPLKRTLGCCLAISLGGCAGLPDSDLTRLQGATMGCVLGAGVGLIIKQSAAAGVAGCAAGGGVGYLYGDHVAGKKSQYTSQEDYLNDVIAAGRKLQVETHAYNLRLAEEIKSLREEIRNIEKKIKDHASREAALAKQKEHLARLLANGEMTKAKVNNEIEIQKRVLEEEKSSVQAPVVKKSQLQTVALEQESQALSNAIDQLKNIDQQMIY